MKLKTMLRFLLCFFIISMSNVAFAAGGLVCFLEENINMCF